MLLNIIRSMQNPDNEEAICRVCLKYSIYEKETLEQILRLALKINFQKSSPIKLCQQSNRFEKFQYWGLGELKTFRWILVFYCCYYSIEIIDLSQDQFQQIQKMFPNKPVSFIKYEAYCIHKNAFKNQKLWKDGENIMLKQLIMQSDKKVNWRKISFTLFQESGYLYFRSFSQCREQWINHLDPKIQNKQWSLDEDIKLFILIERFGVKWSRIAREIGSKNQHMVKNRYNSYLKKYQKKQFVGKYYIDEKILPYLQVIMVKQDEQITKTVEVQQNKNSQQLPQTINYSSFSLITPLLQENNSLKSEISSNNSGKQDIDQYLELFIN